MPWDLDKLNKSTTPVKPEEDEESRGQRTQNTLASLLRVGGGLLGGAGGPWGGAVQGGVEALAQQVEHPFSNPLSKPNLARIVTEGGLGMIPGRAYYSKGRALASAMRSGVLSGAGNIGRQIANKELYSDKPKGEFSIPELGVQTGLGAVTGGVLGHITNDDFHAANLWEKFKQRAGWGKSTPKSPAAVVENGGALGSEAESGQLPIAGAPRTAKSTAPMGNTQVPKEVTEGVDMEWKAPSSTGTPTPSTKGTTGVGVANNPSNIPSERAANKAKAQYAELNRMMDKAERDTNRLELRTRQAKKLEKAKEQLTTAKEQGFVPEETITETYKAPNEKGGDETLTRRWKAAKEEGEGGGRGGGKRTSQATISNEDTIVPLNPDGTPAPRPPAPTPEEQVKIRQAWMQEFKNNPEKYGTDISAHAAGAREQGAAGIYPPGYAEDLSPEEIARAAGTPAPSTPPPPNAPPVQGENEHLAKFIGAKLRGQKNPINPVPVGPIALAEDVYNEALKAGMSPKEAHAMAQSVLPGAEINLPKGAGTHSGGGVPPVEAPPTIGSVPVQPEAPIPSWSPLAGRPIPRTGAEMEAGPLIEGGAAPLNFIRGKNYSQYLKSQYGELKDLLKAHPKETWSSPDVAPLHTQYKEAGKLAETRKRSEKAGRLKSWDELNRKGGTTLGAGIDPTKLADYFVNNPKGALEVMLGIGGGLVGGMTDPLDNPTLSAIAGAGAGMALPTAAGKVSSKVGDVLKNSGQLDELLSKATSLAPRYMRTSLLANPIRYPANAILGPWGSGVMGSLEQGLSGNPEGWKALRQFTPTNYLKTYWKSLPEATRTVGRTEDLALGANPSATDIALSALGVGMTAGDVSSRTLQEAGGLSEKIAREHTLTSEARFPFMRHIQDLAKGSKLGQFFLPFSRTLADYLEQGVKRTPLLGLFAHKAERSLGLPDLASAKQIAVQQGLGLGMGGLGAAAGYYDSPEDKIVPSYLSNMAGVYGLPTMAGFAVGRGMQKGTVNGLLSGAGEATSSILRDVPLPSTRILNELKDFVGSEGQKVPKSFIPDAVEMGYDYLKPAPPKRYAVPRLRMEF